MDLLQSFELSIAGISIRLDLDQPVPIDEAFIPFFCSTDKPQFCAAFRKVDKLVNVPTEMIHEGTCFRVHSDGKGGILRSFFDAPRDYTPYALTQCDYRKGYICVNYLEKGKRCVSEMSNSFFHLGIESIMLEKQRLFLHAACVATPLGGILFSGPSGIGKSTQAELWCRYRSGRLINGDRTIISQEDDTYYGWGSPYAGSSRCYVNEKATITAIVMLKQAGLNSIRRLEPGEAFRKIYSGLTVSSWDKNGVEKTCDLALQMAMRIPVYEFACTPDKYAVEYLEKALQGVSDL